MLLLSFLLRFNQTLLFLKSKSKRLFKKSTILNGERRNTRMMIDSEKTVRMIWINSMTAFKKKKTKLNGTSCLTMMRLLMKMILNQITSLIDLQLRSSFQMKKESIRKLK